jgi:Fe-S-cluster containining protein
MGSYEENYLNKRPQSLCKMCGKCCRVVHVPITHEELKQKAKDGEQGAIDFLSLFVPYKSIDEARKADAPTVDNIVARITEDNIHKVSTFYYCKYLQDDNKCSNYENRPALCRHCPSTPWDIVPPECGFEGWLFMKREEDKQKIRKAKEELIELKLLRKRTTNEETLKKIALVEQKIYRNIELFKKYGSENW